MVQVFPTSRLLSKVPLFTFLATQAYCQQLADPSGCLSNSATNLTNRQDMLSSVDDARCLTRRVLGAIPTNSEILKIVTVEEPPFVILKRRTNSDASVVRGEYEIPNSDFEFDGYLPELLDQVVGTLNADIQGGSVAKTLRYQFINAKALHEEGFYGYTSTVESLSSGPVSQHVTATTADLVWAPHWLVTSRFGKNVRWLSPHMTKGTGLITRKATQKKCRLRKIRN